MQTHCTFRLLDSTAGQRLPVTEVTDDPAVPGQGQKLLCRACRFPVTDDGQRVSVAGGHVHVRANPAGIEFRFGCFALAPGCSLQGAPTAEYSWFAGCRWRIALCGGCAAHLGWSFDGSESFFALILSRIAADAH